VRCPGNSCDPNWGKRRDIIGMVCSADIGRATLAAKFFQPTMFTSARRLVTVEILEHERPDLSH
jgi:hypothetical protein